MNNPAKRFNTEKLRNVRNIIPPVPARFKLPPVSARLKRVKGEERIQEAFQNIPKITNETVAEHREHVLRGARKYKYPLQHSKHRIVIISTGLGIIAAVVFLVYLGLALYKFQSSSAFIYRVTQVLPVPVAKAGDHYVSYEDYLFQLRRYKHYYSTQQRVDFGSQDGKKQLATYKPVAMNQVVQAAYVKQLAAEHHVSVSGAEVNAQMASLQAQNQTSSQELADVTRKFFGWSIDDLKRKLKEELLAQKVAATLDTETKTRAGDVLAQLQAGKNFGELAGQYSDDGATKGNGGKYANTAITAASTDVPPAVVRQLQTMTPGQVSSVIEAGTTLEIVQLIANDNGKMQAAHISFNLASIETFVQTYTKKHPSRVFVKVQ